MSWRVGIMLFDGGGYIGLECSGFGNPRAKVFMHATHGYYGLENHQ